MMRKIAFLLVFLFSISSAFAQDRTLTGKVVDETGAGLIGATVQLKGSQKGAVTDVDGKYTLSIPSTGAVLVISYVGYTAQEVTVGESNIIDVNMSADVQNLEQVVVVGYGVQKKSLVTGSISKVDSKDITAMPATRVEQALQGKTSGVYIAQSSGTPGGAMSIRIRGNSSDGQNNPIYIVDGVKTGGIDYLSPNDIESVEILKDAASSAIYGAEGGNGVVIISTKKGKKGSSEITYNYYHGWQNPGHTVKPMDADQYISYMKEANIWENPKYVKDSVKNRTNFNKRLKVLNEMDSLGSNTNWIDEIFNAAPVDEHNITFSSGTDRGNFLLSGSYYNQDGLIGGAKNNYRRYTFRFNGESKMKEWLTVGSNVSYTNSRKRNLTENTDFFGGIINSAIYFDPTVAPVYNDTSELPNSYKSNPAILKALVRDSKGRIFKNSSETTGDVANPLALIENTYNTTTTNKVLADIHADVKFFEGFKYTSKLAVDYSLVTDDVFNPKFYYDDVQKQVNDTAVTVQNTYTKYYKYAFDNFVTFSRTFGDHGIEAMVGMSYENYSPTYLYGQGYHILYNNPKFAYLHVSRSYAPNYLAITDGGPGTRNQYDLKEIQSSYFGRFVYNYKEKYMLQGNFRRDGSSLFGPNNRFATFPSFSLGWNISREEFFKNNISFINTFKARFSWGQNGNKQILTPFGYTSVMNTSAAYSDATGTVHLGTILARPGNPNIVWETSQQSDFGIELGLLKNRITFSMDRFVKTTKDQLGEDSKVPDFYGFTAKPYVNRGEVQNKGWEFDLTYREMDKEFKYTITGNVSYIKNEVLSYGTGATYKDGYKMNTGDIVTRYEAGYPVWYFRGFKAIGIFQDTTEIKDYYNVPSYKAAYEGKSITSVPGDVKFADVAGKDANGKVVMTPDGKLDDADRVMIGKPNPDWIFGLNLSCEFKGVDFSAFFQGVTGNQIFFSAIRGDRGTYNKPELFYNERWTGPGTSNKYPRATVTDRGRNMSASTLNISDGDYLRLKSLSIGYTLPQNLTKKAGINKLRVYTTATNLLTFTAYKGTDPEIGQMDVSTNNSWGIDRGLYPQPKVYTLGVNVSF